MKRLKNDEGIVVEVIDSACFQPDEDGTIMATLGGFAYFEGKETEDEPTHTVQEKGGLFGERGDLIPIGECE